MVYPALLPLMRTPRLPVVGWTDAPRRFKWTHPFRRKTKSCFCACAITIEMQPTPQCFLFVQPLTAFLATFADKPRTGLEPSVANKCSTTHVTYVVYTYGITWALFRMKGQVHFFGKFCGWETFHTNLHTVPGTLDVASNLKPVLFIVVSCSRSW
jgi:hypothetical protein